MDRNKIGRTCSANGGEERLYRILVGKFHRKSPLGRHGHRWKYNIRVELQEVDFGVMDSMELDQDRGRWQAHVDAIMKLRVQ